MNAHKTLTRCLLSLALVLGMTLLTPGTGAQQTSVYNVKEHYTKAEYDIPMRDGVKLHTVVYVPRDTTQTYPILMQRTPYGAGPYGQSLYRPALGPSPAFVQEGYIFVYQDVRGTFMSEGEFEDVRPHNPNKKTKQDIDEASDTYDTIEWLLKNVSPNNGRVGIWGISYPGFYTTTALMEPHPALKAASPQAPIADWFIGDDDHRNGALFLFDSFGFNTFFGMPRPRPTQNQFTNFDYGTPDAYQYFLRLGTVANTMKYFQGKNKYINDVMAHPNYDEFWQARSVLPHLKKVTPAVMIVGGWFDAEDLYGPLRTYATIEKNNPNAKNILVMGPWSHGQWSRGTGESLGNIRFEVKTSEWYREQMELPFFNFYLKDKGELKLPEATMFRTGANEWKTFAQWPPAELQNRKLYFQANGKLSFAAPSASGEAYDQYLSDPAKPVPYTNEITDNRGAGYMIEDQRFAARRPDVLVYESDVLTEEVTLAGPLLADLFVSTTGTDADFIVKLIDVLPDNAPNNSPAGPRVKMGGFQMLVRAEMMRGRFRNSLSKPEAFTPNQPTEVKIGLNDVFHTFKPGHRIMVQVQSSWFPLADRNPQTFVDIYHAKESDFQAATHRVYRAGTRSSHIQVGVWR